MKLEFKLRSPLLKAQDHDPLLPLATEAMRVPGEPHELPQLCSFLEPKKGLGTPAHSSESPEDPALALRVSDPTVF